ncbi:hypothetical protein MAPG_07283 [Magnaporthiopsis poae ATCC 64411]|uniref:Uncharacterized protein n=1 Tax=Magnaporthiopsis poae (strain ATCC 64411 / 73-15) TaxID=644358 RepID=A0A0C4E492_MAGP6|nr:hypothetical protein MAPG_07283 [Magnaporthiopsis poae ATCC 64411]
MGDAQALTGSVPADEAIDTSKIWKAAIDQYEKIAGVRMATLNGVNTIEDILKEVRTSERMFLSRRHSGSRSDRLRTLLSQNIRSIQQLLEITVQASKAAFPPSEAIFAAIKYLITTANAVSSDYDKVASLFEDLQSYLVRLKVLEGKVPPFPELIAVITEILTSVLVVLGVFTECIQTKRIVKTLRSLVSGEDVELRTALDRFHKLVEREEGVVRNAIFVSVTEVKSNVQSAHTSGQKGVAALGSGIAELKTEVQAAHTEVGTGVAELKLDIEAAHTGVTNILTGISDNAQAILTNTTSQESSREREEILTWLSPLNYRNKQHAIFDKYHSGTVQWLMGSEPFQRWLQGDQTSTLWCPGDAGAGKTVMVSAVVDYICTRIDRSRVAVAFVYCEHSDPTSRSEVGVLSSITRQLVEQCAHMPSEIRAFRDRYAGGVIRPTVEERIGLVRLLAQRFDRTYILIDALDECTEKDQSNILRYTSTLERDIRLLITSRPVLDLQDTFSSLCRIDITAHESDIRVYLESEIDTDKRMRHFTTIDQNLRADIIRSLQVMADGMFLLAHLYIRLLCDQLNVRNVRRALGKAPANLFAFYDVAMARIADQPEPRKQAVKTALCYLFCAKRPLNTEELLHALGVEINDIGLDEAAIPDIRFVLSDSVGLIRADTRTGMVGLVHHTLHEYLKSRPGQLLPWPEREMARVCLVYLNFDEFQGGPCSDAKDLEKRLQNYRFYDYASHHWGSHCRHSQTDTPEDMDLLQRFLRHEGKLSSSIQVLHMSRHRTKGWHDRFPRQVSALHAASYWGLDKVAAMVLEEGKVDANHQDSYGATALHLAAQNGYVAVAQLLLDSYPASINLVDNRGRTPVAWASRNGHQAVAELLIARGADTLREDSSKWIALHWATMGGYAELTRVLLSLTPGPERAHRNRALMLAAEAGRIGIIRMLLDDDSSESAGVDGRDEEGKTPVTFSVSLGYVEAVRVFLEKGADVNALDADQNAPLHWAIAGVSMTRLLLGNGARVNAKNDLGKTALHWAVREGREEVAKVLIEAGADVKVADKNNFTPLHSASLVGLEGIARLLLANGARVDVKDVDGWTPLHCAVLRKHDTVVDLLMAQNNDGPQIVTQMTELLQDGALQAMWDDTAQAKSEGSTVVSGLRYAAATRDAEMVLALLENGADIDAMDDVGAWTALTVAARLCHLGVMELLLQNGVAVNKPDRHGQTALHHAVCHKEGLDLVRLLLENGADIEAKAYRWTPLLLAGNLWQPDNAAYLASKGADVNAEDYYGRRILHWAAWNNGTELALLALDRGAEINAADRWGKTALIWAVESRDGPMTELLLERGADATLRARDGTTALHMAAFVGILDLARRLLAKGVDCNARAVGGLTAVHIAAFRGYHAIVKLLLAGGAVASDECQWRVGEFTYAGFDTNVSIKPSELLSNEFRDLVSQKGQDSVVQEVEGQRSLSVQQLATLGGSTSLLRLFAEQA